MKKREAEMEAVRTTIVGGRPPGSGRNDVAVPRGIEVLVKKAAVDEEFRRKLLAQRGTAAEAIGLELDPAEAAMLGVIAEEQLAGIIRQTVVPPEQRRVFMGAVAAAMLAVLGVGLASCQKSDAPGAQAGAPTQATNPQNPPQVEPQIIRGLRAAPTPADANTQTAPATGDATPPHPVTAVFGLRMEPPPATSTQPATAPAGDPQRGLMVVAGNVVFISPASTQPTTGPGEVIPIQPPPLIVAGMMALPPSPPFPGQIAGILIDRPPEPATQPATQPATLPATQPATATNPPAAGQAPPGLYGGAGGSGGAGPRRGPGN